MATSADFTSAELIGLRIPKAPQSFNLYSMSPRSGTTLQYLSSHIGLGNTGGAGGYSNNIHHRLRQQVYVAIIKTELFSRNPKKTPSTGKKYHPPV